MSAHQSLTARRPFVACVCTGLLALAGCLLLAGLLITGPAPAHGPPAPPTLLAEPMAAGKASAPGPQAANPGLQQVSAANAFPLSAVVHLVMTFPDGQTRIGSGAVVDRFHVLTAGHVVYQSHHGGWVKTVNVYAGQTGSTVPFKVAHGTYFRTFNSFVADDQKSKEGEHAPGDGDIGMITLDRTLGDETGWFGIGYNDDSDFKGWSATKAGYPGTPYSGNDMYIEQGPILGAHPGTSPAFGYFDWDTRTMTSIGGESGSGLYDSGNKVIYAVLDAGSTDRGYAEPITKAVFDEIQNWIAADGQPNS
jgi:V8-like Glu-specific endopeptidase